MADRILSYGYSVVTMDDAARLDIIDLTSARKAVHALLKRTRAVEKALRDPVFTKKWNDGERARAERRSTQAAEKHKEDWEKQSYRKTPEGKAQLAAQKQIKAELPKDKGEAAVKIAKALDVTKKFGSLYDSIKLGGRSIGDVHYRELDKLRQEGLYEGALCDQILRYARPNNNAAIRDIIKEDVLKGFELAARDAVRKIENEGIETVILGNTAKKWSWKV